MTPARRRAGVYAANGTALTTNIGGPGSPVSGAQFGGTSAIGGTWYLGTDFPALYRNSYFMADYEGGWIRSFSFNTDNRPVAVRSFATGAFGVVSISSHPVDGSLYYVTWTNGIRRIRYGIGLNQAPKAVAKPSVVYGPSPLSIQFDGSGSSDPEGLPLAYRWDFGDGTPASTQTNVLHTFAAPAGVPTPFTVKLTLTDKSNATAEATVLVSVNNTPPAVTLLGPTNGTLYPLATETTYELGALITDAEHRPDQLHCAWATTLHHNNHVHSDPVDTNCTTRLTLSPLGCDGEIYFYTVALTVTDDGGLATTQAVTLYPDCQSLAPGLRYLGLDPLGARRWLITGDPGRGYLVEASTNLVDWVPVTTVPPGQAATEFKDPGDGLPRSRFYRAVLTP